MLSFVLACQLDSFRGFLVTSAIGLRQRIGREALKLAVVTGWVPDVLPGYWQRTIPLGPDPDGRG